MNNKTNSNNNKPTKYCALPAFNQAARKNSNLATNLATTGLFSALAACGGASLDSVNVFNIANNSGDSGSDAINFATFTAALNPVAGITHHGDANTADTTSITIAENVEVGSNGTVLGAIVASDQDRGAITYSITAASGYDFAGEAFNDYFEVDGDGNLKLKQSFDHENSGLGSDKKLTFTIQASPGADGSGATPDTHTVTIEIANVDEAPAFGGFDPVAALVDGDTHDGTRYASGNEDTTTLYIREDLDSANALGSIAASGDSGITYSIAESGTFDYGDGSSNNIADYFSIGENDGALSLAVGKKFDFGTTMGSTHEDISFTVTIQASSLAGSDTHAIKVQLGERFVATRAEFNFYGSIGDDYIKDFDGDSVLHIHPGLGNDVVYAGGGNDVVLGEGGDDILYGGLGSDTIYGDGDIFANGDDIIYGGAGNDELHGDDLQGNGGADKFVVNGVATFDNGQDTVKDFGSLEGDKIVIEGGGESWETISVDNTGQHSIVTGYGAAGSTMTVEGINLGQGDFDFTA